MKKVMEWLKADFSAGRITLDEYTERIMECTQEPEKKVKPVVVDSDSDYEKPKKKLSSENVEKSTKKAFSKSKNKKSAKEGGNSEVVKTYKYFSHFQPAQFTEKITEKRESQHKKPPKQEPINYILPFFKTKPLEIKPEFLGQTELQVRNISKITSNLALRALFIQFGPLVKCKYNSCNRIAFIQYKTHREAVKARMGCHGVEYDGNRISVDFVASEKGGVRDTVFCAGLDVLTDEGSIGRFFGEVGHVVEIRIAKDKGFAHVEFEAAVDAAYAVEQLNG